MEIKELKAQIEAILFANAEPLSSAKIADILQVEEELVERLILAAKDACESDERGIQLIKFESGWQYCTKPHLGDIVKIALDKRRQTPLSAAALEVLAIIAYNQPVSRSFIEQVRGVDSSSTVSLLCEKELICEYGRLDLPGKPIAFRTTDVFLRSFGIESLSQLPALHTGDTQEVNEYDLMR
jgi:segregation and condensation protein B